MKITTFGRQVEVTEDLKILIEKKLGKLDKFFRDDADCNAQMIKEDFFNETTCY